MSGETIILATGGLAFAAHFKESGGFPDTGYGIIGATVALTFIAAFTRKTSLAPAVKALAILMFLGALYRFVPAFTAKDD